MRNTIRWISAVLLYGLILAICFAVSFGLAWSCHHGQPADSFVCSRGFRQIVGPLTIGVIVLGHSLASILAILLAPAYKRRVAVLAVFGPVVYLSYSLRNGVTGEWDLLEVLPVILVAIPGAIAAFFLVRRSERLSSPPSTTSATQS